MSLETSIASLVYKLSIGAIDKYTFKKELGGVSPNDALNYCVLEVGICAKLCLKGSLSVNSDRYSKARESALYLAGQLKPKGVASHYAKEILAGIGNFTLYSFRRKFIPDDYLNRPYKLADIDYFDNIIEFVKLVQERNHKRLSWYAERNNYMIARNVYW